MLRPFLAVGLTLTMLVAACAAPTPTAAPEPTATPTPTTTPTPAPTATPPPMPTPTPTATPTATPTPTPIPTATPTPTLTPTPKPRPTATPLATPTPTPIPRTIHVNREIWECYADRRESGQVAGCSGWEKPYVTRWHSNTVRFRFEESVAESDSRAMRRAMSIAAPVLNLTFIEKPNDADLTIRAYWEDAPPQPGEIRCPSSPTVGACGGGVEYDGEIREGFVSIVNKRMPANSRPDYVEEDLTTGLMLHELLHAVTLIGHNVRLDSVMSTNPDAIHSPIILPLDEELFRLNSHPDVEPGMSMDDLEQRLLFVDNIPEPQDVHEVAATVFLAGTNVKWTESVGCGEPQDSYYADVIKVLGSIAHYPSNPALRAQYGIDVNRIRIEGSTQLNFWGDGLWATGSDVEFDIHIHPHTYQVEQFTLVWIMHTTPRYSGVCSRYIGRGGY